MIVLIASEKGGCMKSTLATNVAALFRSRGSHPALLDADRQGSAKNWCVRRVAAGYGEIECAVGGGDVSELARKLEAQADMVIIDAGGRDSAEMRSGMISADIMIMPLQVGIPDVETMERMSGLIEEERQINPDLQVFVVLSRVPNTPNRQEQMDAVDALSEYHGWRVARTVIRDRKIYRDAMIDGCGVVEVAARKSGAARAEMQLLVDEIFEGIA